MKQDSRFLRAWVDVTGFVVPLIFIVGYLLGWPSAVRTALGALFFAGMFSTWLLTEDLPRWRARHAARLRRLHLRRR